VTSLAARDKTAAETAGKETGQGPEEKSSVSGDISHFGKLRQRKEELDRREKELVELEEELHKQKSELDKRISQLEEMRNQIAQILKDRVDVDQEKVNKLVELYSNMKPKQAADVIGSINEDLAVEILAKMKKKNAAEIMNLLPPEKSKVLSEKYTGYRRSHSEPKG
jgi:flagellar motility protein MotE (MotC chaperone)